MRRGAKTGVLDERARATRRKILVEASKLFARKGYHGTTVADVAKAIGMTQGALFYHFDTKEALLYAVVERLSRGFDDYRKLAEGLPASDEMVGSVVRLMIEHYRRQPESTICLACLATEFAGSGHPILGEIRRAYDAFVSPFTTALATQPGVRNPAAAARAFIGAVQGIAIQGLLNEGDPTLEQMGTAFLDLLHIPQSA